MDEFLSRYTPEQVKQFKSKTYGIFHTNSVDTNPDFDVKKFMKDAYKDFVVEKVINKPVSEQSNEPLIEDFYDHLVMLLTIENAFSRFQNNLYDYQNKGDIRSIRIYHFEKDPTNWIEKAFEWQHTPEGKDYWICIDKKWDRFLITRTRIKEYKVKLSS